MFWHMQIFPGDASENERVRYTNEALKEKIIGFGCGCEPLPEESEQEFLDSTKDKCLCELSEEEREKFLSIIKKYYNEYCGCAGSQKGEIDDIRRVVFEYFCKEMQKEDIVLVHIGAKPIALVKVTSDPFKVDGHEWIVIARKVEILYQWSEDTKDIVKATRGTLQPLRDENSETYKLIEQKLGEVKKNK